MALGKVLARGQVTLPRDVRRAAGIQAGDTVRFRVIGPGKVEIRLFPRMRFSEALARYRIDRPLEETKDREAWQAQAATDVLGERDG